MQLSILLLRLDLCLHKGLQQSGDYQVKWMGDNNLTLNKSNLNGINLKITVSSISEGKELSVLWQYSCNEEVTFEYTRDWDLERFIKYLSPDYKLVQDKRRLTLKVTKGRMNSLFSKGRVTKRARTIGAEKSLGTYYLTF